MRLACVADADPSSAGEPPPAPLLSVNGTSFPLDPRRVYFVDLWSPPTEMGFLEQLAKSTICFRSPSCKVVMTTDRRAATVQNKWPTLNSVSSPSTAKIIAAMP